MLTKSVELKWRVEKSQSVVRGMVVDRQIDITITTYRLFGFLPIYRRTVEVHTESN